MIWQIEWSPRALRELRSLTATNRPLAVQILDSLDRFAQTGEGDVKKLKGRGREWRLRVREWRVILDRDDATHLVRVLRIAPRGRAYRD